jgi:peptidoglycan/LPS O-acetylase OafA/YrhL
MFTTRRERYNSEELKARLIFVVGIGLTMSFVAALLTILYGLLFISQPITKQAPNDAAAWELLTPMVLFLTGALSGVLASNGMKGKKDND